MTRASSIRIPAAPAHAGDATRSSSILLGPQPAHPSTATVQERTLFAAPSMVGVDDTKLDVWHLVPQQLEVLHKLLGLKATSMSQAQRATYAAALRNALRQLSPGAAPEVAPQSGRAQQGVEHLGATPHRGYVPSEPAAASESIGVEHS